MDRWACRWGGWWRMRGRPRSGGRGGTRGCPAHGCSPGEGRAAGVHPVDHGSALGCRRSGRGQVGAQERSAEEHFTVPLRASRRSRMFWSPDPGGVEAGSKPRPSVGDGEHKIAVLLREADARGSGIRVLGRVLERLEHAEVPGPVCGKGSVPDVIPVHGQVWRSTSPHAPAGGRDGPRPGAGKVAREAAEQGLVRIPSSATGREPTRVLRGEDRPTENFGWICGCCSEPLRSDWDWTTW
jgi:hypothetical protein